ncbi:MAG: hypothetical protein UY92_C0002G0041 [Candidatus Magasanikbacteria bacterium GW2011_GWA2_56_11]|uniref:Uncharacterized protein n=1 Tax=Candidatus Magasanikbacteria bacterium GW2011_GWA2_56_11 TaxID=1619044 RepID=A0A0G2BBI7_9BACT|nr:MAG: hypothetical protein UY92_C0002G0041 [Candidatus Magasanikbacteria bacterium GW2011_GWA2_56_11]
MADGFWCPHCETSRSLRILQSVDIGAAGNFDEVAIQSIECDRCGKRGMAIYEESRRGALDDESVAHTGYWLDRETAVHIGLLLSACQGGPRQNESGAELKKRYSGHFTAAPIAVAGKEGFPLEYR